MSKRSLRNVVSRINQNAAVRYLKNGRNRFVDNCFRLMRRSAGRAFADELRSCGAENLGFVVAFNTPWVVDTMTKAWLYHSTGMKLVVVDNSSDRSARDEIARICRSRGISYFALPPNPEWNPCRSHGIALNWIFHNIVRQVQPKLFGFLDHDCFPIAPVDIPERMTGKAVYGLKQQTGGDERGWYLWAGFCFFRFSAVENIDLDFKHRIEFGMDTGGGNWPRLYGGLASDAVGAVDVRQTETTIGEDQTLLQIIDGDFLHVGGASYRQDVAKRQSRDLLAEHIRESYLGGPAGRESSI